MLIYSATNKISNKYCVIFRDKQQVHKLYSKGWKYHSYQVKPTETFFNYL